MRPRVLTIVIHAVCWLLFLSLPLVFIGGASNGYIRVVLSSFEYWFFCLTFIALFYLVANLLIPYFFFRKLYFTFWSAIAVLFVVIVWLSPFDRLMSAGRPYIWARERRMDVNGRRPFSPPDPDRPLPGTDGSSRSEGRPALPADRVPFDAASPERRFENGPMGDHGPRRNRIDIVSIFMFLIVLALGMTIRISRQWRITEARAVKAEAGRARAELSFLKAQINPHFLFNTLNNLYVLALTRSDHTAESIMRLSNIMRYVTDEAGREMVTLHEEIACIADYIELQRLRIAAPTSISFDVQPGLDNRRIPPLILMTFVENAFKYGISTHHQSAIAISLSESDSQLQFLCSNPVFPGADPRERPGVGISNARQRLDYLYGDKYLLQTGNDGRHFNVKLVISLLEKV